MAELNEYPNLIAGKLTKSESPVTITNPYDGSPLGTVFLAVKDDAERAIECAAGAKDRVRKIPAHERKATLLRIVDLLNEESDRLAELMTRETGKPIKLTRAELSRTQETLALSAEEAGRMTGEFLPLDMSPGADNRIGITRRVPLGVVTAITPFNFPLNLLAHKVGPAIAVGAPVIHKPCMQAPLTAFEFARIVYEAGWPGDAYSVLYAEPDVAEALVTDERIAVLSFTGSDTVGWKLKSIAGKKKVHLELGGSASCILEPDLPDWDYALTRCVAGSFAYSGQVCISIQRMMVHEKIYDKFTADFIERTRKLKIGDPLDESTDIGPVIDDAAAERIERWVESAVSAGAGKLYGKALGERMFEPVILENVPDETEIGCREIFGPVVSLCPYSSLDTAIAMTNNSRYGLQSGIFTSDIDKAFKAFENIVVGGLIVNDTPMWRGDAMPYGGTKDSGEGREGPRFAVEEYTETRLMVVRLSGE